MRDAMVKSFLSGRTFSAWRPRGDSVTDSEPCHSVLGSLPSTGRVQSKDVSRRGMKLEWKYAMSPLASAKVVLFDEFVCSSIVWRKDLRFLAFIRVNDWISASIGFCISLTATHFPFTSRTIGPCWV